MTIAGRAILAGATGAAAPGAVATVAARLASWRAAPDRPDALRLLHAGGPDETLSRHELIDRAVAHAGVVRERGVEPGARIALVQPHGAGLYVSFLGAILAGAVPSIWAPPSPKVAPEDYRRVQRGLLSTARPHAVAAPPEIVRQLAEDIVELGAAAPLVLPLDDEVASGFGPGHAGASLEAAVRATRPNDVAFIQYSSGTTGARKGVAIRHAALLWQVDAYADAIGLDESDRIASWLPLYHDMGLVACFLMPVLRGVPIVAQCPFAWVARPASWIEAVDAHGATLSWLPNFAYAFLARAVSDAELAGCSLASMRGIVNCSEAVRAESHDAFRRRFEGRGLRPGALATCYAMAENTFAVTSGGFGTEVCTVEVDAVRFAREGIAGPASGAAARRIVSSGVPLPETAVRILGADGAPLPDGREGEIELASPCMLDGYDRNPDATARALVEGRLRTGDLGFVLDGQLFVTGRADDRINVRGHDIQPEDAEHAASAVDGVVPGRVVALGAPDEANGTQALVVLAESKESAAAARQRIAAAVRTRVAAEVGIPPSDVRVLEHMALVKSSSGKIARRANLERYLEWTRLGVVGGGAAGQAGERGGAAFVEPRLGPTVRATIEAVVRDRHPGALAPDTPLVSSGIVDSLALVGLVQALESACGVALGAGAIAAAGELDTVADFERLVSQRLAARTTAPAEPLRHGAAAVLPERPLAPRPTRGWRSWATRLRCLRHGLACGGGLWVRGPLMLRLEGERGATISIGRNVTLMPGVDLKIRERGRITIHDGVLLDTNVRLVAANDAHLEVGADARIAMGTIVNAGVDVTIGRGTAIGGFTTIVSSDHEYMGPEPIMDQGFWHEPVTIGAECWIASGALVMPGAIMGDGAVLGAQSILGGVVPPRGVAAGRPARVIRMRPPAAGGSDDR